MAVGDSYIRRLPSIGRGTVAHPVDGFWRGRVVQCNATAALIPIVMNGYIVFCIAPRAALPRARMMSLRNRGQSVDDPRCILAASPR